MNTAKSNGTAPAATAASPATMTSLAEFQELARVSLTRETKPAAAAATAPGATAETQQPAEAAKPAAGQESPPVNGEATQGLEAVEAPETPENPETPEAQPAENPEEEHDATPEEQAQWTDGERRIHGALVKEREARKQAKQENAELRQRMEQLEAKLNTNQTTQPDPNKARPANGTAAADPNPQRSPAPSAAASPLGDCMTFEAVDARAMQAANTESQVLRLQGKLTRGGAEAAAAELKNMGVTQLNGMPVAELDANAIGDFLDAALHGAKQAQAAAPQRKQFLNAVGLSWEATAKTVPELNDTNSETYRGVCQLIQSAPELAQRPNWPELAVRLVLGGQALTAKQAQPAGNGVRTAATVAAAKAAAPTTAKPGARQAPGAPRRTAAALPAASADEALRKKMADGTATLADVQSLARGSISVA